MRFWLTLLFSIFVALSPFSSLADTIPVRFKEGSVHAYISLKAADDKILASGTLIQTVRGDRINSRLTFHFRDGSLDDERVIFTQAENLKLLSDHHIQKGPAFPEWTDVFIDASRCLVTVRSTKHGKTTLETQHLDLPPDLANGLLMTILRNIRPDAKETKVSYVAASPKPRVVKLSIAPQGDDSFLVAGSRFKATRFVVKVELGGITGMVAPLVGKQPADTFIWMAMDEVPAFVKSSGPFFVGGPIWTIEMATPVWP